MFNNTQFYKVISGKRVYSETISSYDIYYAEFYTQLLDHISWGYKIYFLKCKSKHNFFLNHEDLKYLNTQDARVNEPLYYCFSKNIENIKYYQRSDLFFLTSLKNLGLLVLIPKLDKNNKYYFNLIIGVKAEFDVSQLNKWGFKSIIIDSCIELNNFNLNIDFLKKIFDIENNKFKDNRTNTEEVKLWKNKFIDDNSKNPKLTKQGRRVYKKIIFKEICFHLYWLDGDYQLKNSSFEIDYGFKEKILIPDGKNNFRVIESYSHCCLEDLIGYDEDVFHFSFWRIYQNY